MTLINERYMDPKAHAREAVNNGSSGMMASHVMTGEATPPVMVALYKTTPMSVVW
jgi:hypothetical protein